MLDGYLCLGLLLLGLTGIVISERYKLHFEFNNPVFRLKLGIEPRDCQSAVRNSLEQAPETPLLNNSDTLN
jgi:hypothetical protein